jgi:hypothetical protein
MVDVGANLGLEKGSPGKRTSGNVDRWPRWKNSNTRHGCLDVAPGDVDKEDLLDGPRLSWQRG